MVIIILGGVKIWKWIIGIKPNVKVPKTPTCPKCKLKAKKGDVFCRSCGYELK